MLELEKRRTLEMAVMKISHTYLCRKCRRTYTVTEIYLLVRGVPLNAEILHGKGGLPTK